MAKTAAQRQAQYRASRQFAGDDGNGERRLSIWVNTSTDLAIARLARRYRVTKREIIEKLIRTEDERTIAGIEFESKDWDEYFATPAVTQ